MSSSYGWCICSASTRSCKMYRWTDENGRVFYSDQVPPAQSKFARNELSDTARVTKTIRAAKTVEQIALEARLDELRLEQEKSLLSKRLMIKCC